MAIIARSSASTVSTRCGSTPRRARQVPSAFLTLVLAWMRGSHGRLLASTSTLAGAEGWAVAVGAAATAGTAGTGGMTGAAAPPSGGSGMLAMEDGSPGTGGRLLPKPIELASTNTCGDG